MDLIPLLNIIDAAHYGSRIPKHLLAQRIGTGKCQFHLMFHLAQKCRELGLSICVIGTHCYVPVLGDGITHITTKKELTSLDKSFDVYVVTGNIPAYNYLKSYAGKGSVVIIDDWRVVHMRYKRLMKTATFKKYLVNEWPDPKPGRVYPETWWNHLVVLWM